VLLVGFWSFCMISEASEDERVAQWTKDTELLLCLLVLIVDDVVGRSIYCRILKDTS
jgi:hypothetical protein